MNKLNPKHVHASLWAIAISCLLVGCNKASLNEYNEEGKVHTLNAAAPEIIYLQTNNYHQGQNAIIGYRNYGDGQLVLMPEGPFLTGGNGMPSTLDFGPFESNQEVRLSNDKRFLLTVNSGNNTISVFAIQPDGTLKLVPGSPFPSGGETPVSIDHWEQYIIVLNKSHTPVQASTLPPNYSIFTLEGDGKLTPVPGGKVELRDGLTPGQVLVSRTGPFIYGSNTYGYNYTPPASRMNIFSIGSSGLLTAGPDAPPFDSISPGTLGLCQSWRQNVLYVAFPFWGRFSYYDMNTTTGALTHIGNTYARPGCSRFCTNNINNRLFTANTTDNSVNMFDITDARAPRNIGLIWLKNPGPVFQGRNGKVVTSQCVSLATSTDDRFLYVISQHANPDIAVESNYNFLHVVQLTGFFGFPDTDTPYQLPIPKNFRPRGLAVLPLSELPK